jgi:hypothetical protein
MATAVSEWDKERATDKGRGGTRKIFHFNNRDTTGV